MSIRADWRLAELDLETDDPFDKVILSTGLQIDLTGGIDAVHLGLAESLQLESRLFNRGVTCDLKDDGQDCLTCPVYCADREQARSKLCRLGRDQRFLENRAGELVAPFKELAETATPYAEMVPDDLSELLVAHGV